MDYLDEAIDKYLTSLHSSQWGRSISLIREESKKEAIAYIRNIIEQVNIVCLDQA